MGSFYFLQFTNLRSSILARPFELTVFLVQFVYFISLTHHPTMNCTDSILLHNDAFL